MKKYVWAIGTKYDPLVEVELIESNIEYAHVRFRNRIETTISTWHWCFTIRKESIENCDSIVHPEPLSTNEEKEVYKGENYEARSNHEQVQNLEQSFSELPHIAR